MTAGSHLQAGQTGSIYVAPSLSAALDVLTDYGAASAPFAGGTWIMRSPIRHEPLRPHYVAIGRIPELSAIRVGKDAIEFGAAVTHAALAAALIGLPEFGVLASAAGSSANPAIRAMATIGGNLSALDFYAADCVPALLCLDAAVEVASRDDSERMSLIDFLKMRSTFAPGRLLTRIIVPRTERKTAHARLPLRKSGDYPVAIVSLSVNLDADSRVQAVRIAVGSVGRQSMVVTVNSRIHQRREQQRKPDEEIPDNFKSRQGARRVMTDFVDEAKRPVESQSGDEG